MLLLKYNTIKKEQIDKQITKFKIGNSNKYKIEAI